MLRQLTEEELRQGAAAFRAPPTPGMVAATQPTKPRPKPIKAGSPDAAAHSHTVPASEGVPVAETAVPPAKPAAAAPKRARQAPPEAVARQPAPAAPPAAKIGAMGPPKPVDTVPRETSAAPAEVPPEQDKPAFSYLEQVNAMERELMARGRVQEAAEVRGRYNQLIDGQFRTLESNYRTKMLPQVQAIQTALLQHQGKQLPAKLAMEARQTVQQASQQQQEMLGYLYGLVRNEATKGLGIQYFNQSELIEPGVQLADLVVDEKSGMLIGVDAQGQPVNLSSGQPFQFPIAAAEQLYKDLYESDREQNVIVPEGAMVVNSRSGATIARNPKDPAGSPSETLAASKEARNILAGEFGATYDPVRQMMDESLIKDRAGYTKALAEAEAMIRRGVPPQQAANEVAQRYRAATGGSKATAYDGPAIW